MAVLHDRRISRKDRVRIALEAIKNKNKRKMLLPKDVVKEAASPDHPLHSEFEWDDSVAGGKFREYQARQIIRTFVVEFEPSDGSPTRKMRGYVSLLRDRQVEDGGYRATKDVVANKDLLKELEDTFKAELDALTNRFEVLEVLCAKVRSAAGIKK